MMNTRIDRIQNRSPLWTYRYLRRFLSGQEPLTSFDDTHPCVFVLSTGRVGTQTLTSLLGLAKNVFVYHEPVPQLFKLSKLSYASTAENDNLDVLAEAFMLAREEQLNHSLNSCRGYIETGPHATFLAPAILEAIPSVRFIHLVRNPRDVVRSGMRRKWYEGNPADDTRIVPRPGSEAGQLWNAYGAFQKNLWLWTETNQWIFDFSSGVPAEQLMLVRSEEMFAAEEKTLKNLFSFIGSPIPSKTKISRVLGQVINAQSEGEFPESPDWSDAMHDDFATIAGKMAKHFNYEVQ